MKNAWWKKAMAGAALSGVLGFSAGAEAKDQPFVVRYAANGTGDTSFGFLGMTWVDLGGEEGRFTCVTQDAQGRIVAAGSYGPAVGSQMLVARFLPNGNPDTSFSGNGWQTIDFPNSSDDEVHDVAIQGDGRIVLVGRSVVNGQNRMAVVRLLSNGSLDASFRNGGFLQDINNSTTEYARGVSIFGNRIAVTGPVQNWGFLVAVYRVSDGQLDTSFSGDGFVTDTMMGTATSYDVAFDVSGLLVVSGTSANRLAVARYNTVGLLDTGFSGDGRAYWALANHTVHGFSVATLGNIVAVSGSVDTPALNRRFMVAQLRGNGAFDTAFSGDGVQITDFGEAGDEVAWDNAYAPDGRIVAAGGSYLFDDDMGHVARYMGTGALDTSFNGTGRLTFASGGYDYTIAGVAVDANFRTILAGYGE